MFLTGKGFVDVQSLLAGKLRILRWMRGCQIRAEIKFVPQRRRNVSNTYFDTLKTILRYQAFHHQYLRMM